MRERCGWDGGRILFWSGVAPGLVARGGVVLGGGVG